mgnify:CR=1 FL=1
MVQVIGAEAAARAAAFALLVPTVLSEAILADIVRIMVVRMSARISIFHILH